MKFFVEMQEFDKMITSSFDVDPSSINQKNVKEDKKTVPQMSNHHRRQKPWNSLMMQ